MSTQTVVTVDLTHVGWIPILTLAPADQLVIPSVAGSGSYGSGPAYPSGSGTTFDQYPPSVYGEFLAIAPGAEGNMLPHCFVWTVVPIDQPPPSWGVATAYRWNNGAWLLTYKGTVPAKLYAGFNDSAGLDESGSSYEDNSGSFVATFEVSRVVVTRGRARTLTANGTYTRNANGWDGKELTDPFPEGATWTIYNAAGELQSSDSEPAQWNVERAGNRLRVSVPPTAAVGTYIAYSRTSGDDSDHYYYVVFDVIGASMATRATVFEAIQIGGEATPGTAVAATKRLLCTTMETSPVTPLDNFHPTGAKFDTDVTSQKENTEITTITGPISFYDLCYILAGLVRKPYVADNTDDSDAKDWTFRTRTFGPDDVQTYTVEQGSSAGAQKFTYGLVSSGEFSFSRTVAQFSGKGFGQELNSDGVTMTANPTSVKKLPLSPDKVSIFIADTVDGLDDGKLTRLSEAKFTIPERFSPYFVIDSDEPSFSTHVEKYIAATAQIVVEQNSAADEYLGNLRAKDLLYCRITGTGPVIGETTVNHKVQITFPFKFKNSQRGDKNDVYSGTYDMTVVHEDTFLTGCALDIVITNGMAAAGSGISTSGSL